MVKIVSRKNNRNDKLEYGLLDEKNKVMFYWTEWNWSKKEDDYDYNATMFLENGGDKATLAFLKSIDQTKSELPISLKDSEIYGDTEYTGQYTNDACPVPKFEYNQINFKTDSGKDGMLSFQENTQPWFQGDCYEFAQYELVSELEFDMPKFEKTWSWDDPVEKQKENWLKYNAYHPDEWKELSGDELKEFFDKTINVLIEQYETDIKKAENKKKAAEAKKNAEVAKIDNFAKQLNDKSICTAFIVYVNRYKIKDDFQLNALVDMLNVANTKNSK